MKGGHTWWENDQVSMTYSLVTQFKGLSNVDEWLVTLRTRDTMGCRE